MRAKIGAVLLVTAACLAWVLWPVDWGEARVALATARWALLVPVMLLYLVAHSLRAWRLQQLVGQGVGYGRIFAINTIGFLAINVIPLRLGEFVRPYLLLEREGVAFGRGMAAIVMERLLDLTMLLVFLLGLGVVVDLPDSGVQIPVGEGAVDVVQAGQRAVAAVVALGGLGGLALVVVGEPVLLVLARLPLGPRLVGFARKLREGFLDLAGRPVQAVGLLGLSLVIWVVTIGAVGLCMSAFAGLPVGIGPAWATWTITISGMTAVPTAGFFGAYELFCSAALGLWGVPESLAATFGVVLHLTQFGFIVVVGGFFLVVEGMSLRDLVVAAPVGPEPDDRA